MSKVPARRLVSVLPFMKQATEVAEIARDLFILVGGIGGELLSVLEEIRSEDVRHHRALERHFGIGTEDAADVVDDELAEELARH